MIKAIGIDLDGTLLNKQGKVGQKSKREIHRLKDEKITIILASGRHIREIIPISRELCLDKDDYIVCCDGQYICDGLGSVICESEYLSGEDIRLIMNCFAANHGSVITEDVDYCLETSRPRYWIKKLYYRKRANIINYRKLRDLKKIQKVIVAAENFNADMLPYVFHRSNENFVEVLQKGVTKFNALEMILKGENISDEDIVYLGDSYNDIECFEHLPYCVAMGNAVDAIKEMATCITKTNCEDGVGRFLERLRNNRWQF